MNESDIKALRKRAFQYKRKQRLLNQFKQRTNWSDYQIAEVLKHRGDLIRATRGRHRRNGHPASSHQQFIQTSLLKDGWTIDYLMSALAWSHDMKDDFGKTYTYQYNSRRYSPQMALDINRMSRKLEWVYLSFRDEVAQSDAAIRSGGERTMVVKVLDRQHNDLNPIRNTSPKRRRKSGMKVWQSRHSILVMAKELGYMYQELAWLTDWQQKRLEYSNHELDQLVLRPLINP